MMKKYLITERQLNKVLTAKVTKGIGLKIQDNDGEYYKSIIKTFDTDEDFKDWENNLKEGTSIIGVMDIEEEPETLNEEFDLKKKDKDIQILERLIKKKYPFIIGLIVKKIDDMSIFVDIDFDLNKFYKLTNTKPGKKIIENKWWDFLESSGSYFMRYVDEVYKDKVNEIRANIEKELTRIYHVLPKNIIHTKYESWTDEDIDNKINGKNFYKQWRDDKEPMDVYIDDFHPQIDFDKLSQAFSGRN